MKNFILSDGKADSKKALIFSTDNAGTTSLIAEAMKKAEEKKAREEANETRAVPTKKTRINLGAIKVAEVTTEDALNLTLKIQENRQYSEDLGRKRAELEEAIRKIEEMAANNGGGSEVLLLLPPESKKALINNQRGLKTLSQELERLEKDEPGIRAHAELAYLIRKIEIEISLAREGRRMSVAYFFVEIALKSGRFRVATKMECVTKPSHTVLFGTKAIVPVELTRGNKVLAERLIELCKIDKQKETDSFCASIGAMKARGVYSLRQIIARPKGGEVVYIHFPKKQLSGGKWLSSGHILCRVDMDGGDRFRLIILDVIGPENVATEYTRMRKAKRFLPLAFLKAEKITAFIDNQEIFNDTRMFLLDVLRGLEYEQAEAVKAASANEKRS